MGMLKRQARRLLRGKFKDQKLAEEVYAVLASDDVIEIDSPVKIGPTGESVPPLTIINNPSPRASIPPIAIGEAGPEVPDVELPEGLEEFTPEGTGGGAGNSFVGLVGAQTTGVSYNCILTPGPLNAVVAMQNLAVDAVLPVGISVPVIKVGTSYYGFPSVFYEAT